MRYPVSGANATAISPATGTAATGGLIALRTLTTGRVFWLRGISVAKNATSGPLNIYDATTAGATTPTGTTLKLQIPLIIAASGPYQVHNFSAPGIKFSDVACAARLDASGSVAVGGVTVWGYEE